MRGYSSSRLILGTKSDILYRDIQYGGYCHIKTAPLYLLRNRRADVFQYVKSILILRYQEIIYPVT